MIARLSFQCCASSKPQRIMRLLLAALFFSLVGCEWFSGKEKEAAAPPTPPKKEMRFLLLTQGNVLESALAGGARAGLEKAVEALAEIDGALSKFAIRIEEEQLSPATSVESLQGKIDSAAAVFAVLDESASYTAVQAAALSATPFLFLNDGPLRTCSVEKPKDVLPTVWQLGLTDSQIVEPFLIHLAANRDNIESSFRFSFFGTNASWPKHLGTYVLNNVKALGFSVADVQFLDPRIRDFYQPLRSTLRQRADVLFLAVLPEFTAQLYEQTSKMLIYKDFQLATFWALPEERLAAIKGAANGVRTASRFSPIFPDTETQAGHPSWKTAAAQGLRTSVETAAFTAVMLLEEAAKKADSTEAVALNAGLLLTSFDTPQSTLWFNRGNHVLNQPVYAVTVKETEYSEVQYLGDVEHPELLRCSNRRIKQLQAEEEEAYVPLYDG